MNPRRAHAYFLLLMVVIIWGIASPVIKFTQRGIETLPFLTYRFFLAGIFGAVFLWATKTRLPKKGDFLNLCLYGLLTSAISLGFLFLGLERTTVVEANLITATSPLIVSIVSAKFLHDHITNKEKLGLGIAFLGTLLVIFRPLNGHTNGTILGNFFVLLYVLSGTWAAIVGKRLLRKGVKASTLTNFSFVISFIAIGAYALYHLGLPSIVNTVTTLPLEYQLGVWYMAFISGTLAFTLSNTAQKTIEVSESAVFSYLLPVVAVPVAIVWLGEKITPTFVVGAIIIAIGVFIAEWKRRR